MRKWLLAGIILLAFLLRVVGLSSYPVGFTPDEASFGYDAYSILKTGKDQWGEAWPLTLRSFGDLKMPLYTYITIPSIAVFGLNEFGVRLPSAVFGTLAVLFTYLMTEKLFRNRRLALLSALLLAISPWHIALSRGAFEANLTTLFLPLGVWAFLRGIKDKRWMTLAAFAFGLNLFTYHSARLVTPILVFSLILIKRSDLKFDKGRYKIAALTFFLFLFLALYSLFSGAGSRGTDVSIFNPTDKWAAVSQRRYEAVLQAVPDTLARVFSNKATFVFDRFVAGYVSYLSPQFLFTQGAGEWTYGMIPGRGVLYLIEIPFILFALWNLARKRLVVGDSFKFVLVWILLAGIPAALAKGPGFAANRAAVMMPAIQILSALGAVLLFEVFVKRIGKRMLARLFLVAFLASLVFFLEDYRYHAPINGAPSMLYGRQEAVEFVKSAEGNYDQIVFSRSLSEPQIFVAFYTKWDPQDYQRQAQDWLRYEKEGLSFVDQLGEYRLGKYVFSNIGGEKYKDKTGVLLVGKTEEFHQKVTPIKTIYYPDRKPAILIVDPQIVSYAKVN